MSVAPSPFRSRPAGWILLCGLLLSAGGGWMPASWWPGGGRAGGGGAAEWLREAQTLAETGNREGALEALRAGLTAHPWHPELSRERTRVLLEAGDGERLHTWMDDVTLGDPRLAERLFLLPEMRPWLEEARFDTLRREAYRQARD